MLSSTLSQEVAKAKAEVEVKTKLPNDQLAMYERLMLRLYQEVCLIDLTNSIGHVGLIAPTAQ